MAIEEDPPDPNSIHQDERTLRDFAVERRQKKKKKKEKPRENCPNLDESFSLTALGPPSSSFYIPLRRLHNASYMLMVSKLT